MGNKTTPNQLTEAETKGMVTTAGWGTDEREKGNTVDNIMISLHSGVVKW